MARSAPAFSSFSAGEISPLLEGRAGLEKYREGLADLTNMVVMPTGGVKRRPGTEFLGEVKTSSVENRLIPFQFKTSDTYMLEFGNQTMRVFRNDLQVLSNTLITINNVTRANPGVCQSTSSHGLSTGDEIFISAIGGMVELLNRNFTVVVTDGTHFTLKDLFGNAIDTTNFTAFSLSGTVQEIFELATPYIEADLPDLRFAQSADTMFLVHPSYAIRTLTRTDHNAWAFAAITLSGMPRIAITAITRDDPCVLTSNGHGLVNGQQIQIISVVGMTELNNNFYLVANTATNTFQLTTIAGVQVDSNQFTAYTSGGIVIQQTATEINSLNNYPSCVTFFEQRIVYANTTNNPQTIWFSKNADFNNFTIGTGANDALAYTIASNQVNAIRYLSPTRVLTVGTTGGEYVVTATSDGPITPTTTLIRKYSNYGSAAVEPVQVADVTLFAQRGGRKLREFKYVGEVNTGGYQAPDMTVLAEHITDGGITEFAYQQEPESIVWALRSDGTLLGMTFRREEDVVGWHKHIIGGVFGQPTITVSVYANIAVGSKITITKTNGESVTFTSEAAGSSDPSAANGWRPNTSNNVTADNIFTAINAHADFTVANPAAAVVTVAEASRAATGFLTIATSDSTRLAATSESQAVVESIASLPTDTGNDNLYMIVKRTIQNVTKRYIEVLKQFDFGSVTTSAFFVDSGLAYSGAATTSLSGLYHVTGETISILANGATHPDEVVASGAIELDYSATTAAVGYAYISNMQTMRIESGSVDGTSQGKSKRIHAITIRLHETVGIEVGNDSGELDRIPFRDSSMLMDEGIPLFTGDKDIEFSGGFSEDDRIYVRQSQVLPLTVLALFPRMNTFD